MGVVRVNEPTKKKDLNVKTVYERKDYEVDFLASLGNEKYYIQSAYSMDSSEKEAQEKRSLVNIGDSFKKIIITKSRLSPHYDEDGVLHLSLFDFLLDPDSLKR